LTVPISTPIMITVEDAADVAAFQHYVSTPKLVDAVVVPPPPPPTVAAAAPPTVVVPIAPTLSPPIPTLVVPPPAAVLATPAVPTTVSDGSTGVSTAVPGITYVNVTTSPLVSTLRVQQTSYVELYGTTGQTPMV
jgi:hypothetical protein